MMLYAHRRRGSREGGTILSVGLAPMIGARYTTHLGHAGPPDMPVSRARVSPGWRPGEECLGQAALSTTPSGTTPSAA
jgi:hypothetical protein